MPSLTRRTVPESWVEKAPTETRRYHLLRHARHSGSGFAGPSTCHCGGHPPLKGVGSKERRGWPGLCRAEDAAAALFGAADQLDPRFVGFHQASISGEI